MKFLRRRKKLYISPIRLKRQRQAQRELLLCLFLYLIGVGLGAAAAGALAGENGSLFELLAARYLAAARGDFFALFLRLGSGAALFTGAMVIFGLSAAGTPAVLLGLIGSGCSWGFTSGILLRDLGAARALPLFGALLAPAIAAALLKADFAKRAAAASKAVKAKAFSAGSEKAASSEESFLRYAASQCVCGLLVAAAKAALISILPL